MSELIEASGRVTELGQTKTGRPKYKIGGQWYFCDAKLESFPSIGMDVVLRYNLFGDQNNLRGMNSWRTVQNQPQQSAPPAQPASVPSAPVDADSLRFISNCVGSAITSGAIKSPTQIHGWFEAAKLALAGKAFTPDREPNPGNSEDPRNYGDPNW